MLLLRLSATASKSKKGRESVRGRVLQTWCLASVTSAAPDSSCCTEAGRRTTCPSLWLTPLRHHAGHDASCRARTQPNQHQARAMVVKHGAGGPLIFPQAAATSTRARGTATIVGYSLLLSSFHAFVVTLLSPGNPQRLRHGMQ